MEDQNPASVPADTSTQLLEQVQQNAAAVEAAAPVTPPSSPDVTSPAFAPDGLDDYELRSHKERIGIYAAIVASGLTTRTTDVEYIAEHAVKIAQAIVAKVG